MIGSSFGLIFHSTFPASILRSSCFFKGLYGLLNLFKYSILKCLRYIQTNNKTPFIMFYDSTEIFVDTYDKYLAKLMRYALLSF